jgi:hypothetical protein
MGQHVTVAVVEDHPVVTEGVASWIPASGSSWCGRRAT